MKHDDDDSLRTRLDNLYKAAREQLNAVADELRNSAVRIRGRIDSKQIERERRLLFEALGERTYRLYDKGRRQIPETLKETIDKINTIAGRVVEEDQLSSAIEKADEAVRGVFVEVGDAIERRTRKIQKKKEK